MISFTPMTYTDNEGVERGVDIMEWPPEIDLFNFPPSFFGAPATAENYGKVFQITPYARWILNTLIYASLVTVANLFFDGLAGYAFARLRFKGRDLIFSLLMATIMVPFPAIIIPTYLLISSMGLINTFSGLIMPKVSMIFGIFLMRQFFLNLPVEIEEAALIDGASIPRRAFSIIFPMAKPAFITLGIYTFLNTWNDFMWPLIVTTKKEMFTLTIGLNFFKGSFYTVWPYMMAATMLMTAPMILLYFSAQKYFMEVNVSSGMKG
jgi:multiple sugar transport system permease protein